MIHTYHRNVKSIPPDMMFIRMMDPVPHTADAMTSQFRCKLSRKRSICFIEGER